jgi:allantoicase/CubicO group peptidase (beta-lactamase class C family)
MDDLATAERSRWEVWLEIYHERFSLTDFLKIAHEEMHFIRKDLSNSKKIVQVKWDDRTKKWYPIAMNLMIRLMTDRRPVEFATELLLPFTIPSIRENNDPWGAAQYIDPVKFKMDHYITRFNYYFENCGSLDFAILMAKNLALDFDTAKECILNFNQKNILEAAYFHGDIGESKKTLDHMASLEQTLVLNEDQSIKDELKKLGTIYLKKFGMKFLVSAKDKSGLEILTLLKERLKNTHDQEFDNAKNALWEITKKRMLAHPIDTLKTKLETILKKHHVVGSQLSISTGHQKIQNFYFGESIKGKKAVSEKCWFEMASLSKTIASCFAIEYFIKKNIPLNTSVNSLLEKTTSTFRITKNGLNNEQWAEQVTLAHLMSHSALNMHYVNGVPAHLQMPPLLDFLQGNKEYGYPLIEVINPPGEVFHYSGGGFLVLEHLIESLELKSIKELTRHFLDQLGMIEFSFEQTTLQNKEYAYGYSEQGEEIQGTRKMFPAFAAGAMGTAHAMHLFLQHLTCAYHSLLGSSVISHDTAILMLHGSDKGCLKFMGTKMGLGVFTVEAGPNKLAVHQGANDGFRGLYIHCYDGPHIGFGFTILCNGEHNGMLFNSEVAQAIFNELKIEGIDTSKFNTNFERGNIPCEELVNSGYKHLIFNAFKAALPEEIIEHGPIDPLAKYNLAVGGEIIEVSNQKFARAINLISEYLPTFRPDLFGKQGKIMDSWETVRHNQKECDFLILKLKKQSTISYVSISTQFHLGNQAQFVKIEGFDTKASKWIEIISKTDLTGHSLKKMISLSPTIIFDKIQVSLYPDGGLTRLGLYSDELPHFEKNTFQKIEKASSITFNDEIKKTFKPLIIAYTPNEIEIKKNWTALKPREEYDAANSAFGAKILKASNEHYGPAVQIISPFSPMHMFDGLESARSREVGHQEEVLIQLARKTCIHRIEIDFSYFVNNNPFEISIWALSDDQWIYLIQHCNVKAFAGNIKEFKINDHHHFEQIKIITHPDGGMNRVRVFAQHYKLA